MSETDIIQTEEQKKIEGIRIAAANTPLFQDRAMILIREFPKGMRFTISKIRDICTLARVYNNGHPNAWGALMRAAALEGLVRKVEGQYRQSTTPGCHHRMVQVWERI